MDNESQAETRRRNHKLARRVQLGLVSAGLAGSLGIITTVAMHNADATAATSTSDTSTSNSSSGSGSSTAVQVGSSSSTTSHATTSGS
jgi:hypothetical protein